jgi:glycosyltransferase involved in cell wall biosynthesis
MKVIFLTLARISSVEKRGNYQDLVRKIRDEGHDIIVVSPAERKYREGTSLTHEGRASILKVWTPNIQKANLLEKIIGTMSIEYLYLRAISRYFPKISLDLILYSTPPITLLGLISRLKNKTKAFTYLLLKDIFPQNAIDLRLMSETSLIYKYFRKREEDLYKISDWIGCMSMANVDYVLRNNKWVAPDKIEINPNSVEISDLIPSIKTDDGISQLLVGKIVMVYGGNLGKPQGINFLFEVVTACADIENVLFLIIGSGTETQKVVNWIRESDPPNALFIHEMPNDEYSNLLSLCHVGLIFLHPDFTIPNYPSRILPYLQNKLPVLCATDSITDIGSDAEDNEYGFHCQSGDVVKYKKYVRLLAQSEELRDRLGGNGFEYLKMNFNVDYSYKVIMDHFKNGE